MFFNFCAVSTMSYTEKREDHNKTHSEPLHRNQAEQEFLSPLRWILGFVAQALIDSHEYVKVYFLWANPITCQGRWDGCFCILSLGKFLSNPGMPSIEAIEANTLFPSTQDSLDLSDTQFSGWTGKDMVVLQYHDGGTQTLWRKQASEKAPWRR